MSSRIFVVAVLAIVLVGTVLGAPRSSTRTPPAAGSGSGSGSMGAGRSAGSGAGSGSAISPASGPSTPRSLAMRPAKQAHGGFVSDMDCSACHTTAGWRLSTTAGASGFDHDRTGFPLRGRHVQTTCTQCHTGTTPTSTCEGCHRDPHQGRHDEPCAQCHNATAWADTQVLEQHRRTRMPLTGRHAVIDCNACHTRQGGRTFSDLPTDCYACHRAAFHRVQTHPAHDGSEGGRQFSRDCGRCHQTSAWSPAYADPDLLARRALATSGQHDAWFVLSTGSHRGATCVNCHVDQRRTKQVRCDGCHDSLTLRRQHRGAPTSRAPSACLRCHPRGAAR